MEIWNGFSLSSFEWWVDWIVAAGLLVVFGGTYFLMSWGLGRFCFKDGDHESLAQYREASKLSPEEKAQVKGNREAKRELKQAKKMQRKEIASNARRPVKSVIAWRKIRPVYIPVVSLTAVVSLVATPILFTMKDIIATTVSGSNVTVIDTETSRQAAKEAEKNVVTIEEEGIVLLKNENEALPIDLSYDNRVNIFGSCAYGLFYGNGGSGSFQTDGRVTKENGFQTDFPRYATKLEKAMEEAGFEINPNLYNMIKNYYKSRRVSIEECDYDIQCGFNKYTYREIVDSKAPYDYEPPASAYETKFDELGGRSILEDALDFSDTAIFCITRRGSEDEDMNLSDLQLKANEKDVIEMLERNFEKVIILLNVPTVIEAEFLEDAEIDAAVFIGHPGLTGTVAVAEVLSGAVNPSGHLVDTWPYDVTSAPSYQCFGNDTTLTHTGASNGKFTDYIEGIYVGYRYYVTRAKEDPNFNYYDYVQYSFGHGLSYTTFDKSIMEFNIDEEKQTIEFIVEVKNTGDVPGKDVIQIYTHAPYYNGGIEKSWFSLSGYQKTNIIEPGESKNYKISFTFRDIASWSTEEGYYVLESGDYEFSLRENVWDLAETKVEGRENAKKFVLAHDVAFETSYQTGKEYQNIFQDVEWGADDEKIEYLSRSDFEGTWKNTADINTNSVKSRFPGGTSNTAGGDSFEFEDYQLDEDEPTMGADNGLELRDLKDADWDDPLWDDLLDQLTLNDYIDYESRNNQVTKYNLTDCGSFMTAEIASIGKKKAVDYDGPGAAYHSGTGHPSEVIVACSWSDDVGRLMGESIGREGAARGLTGWYAPGINTHRSPFGGRNFEYYSEDPLIAGHMAGYTAQGAMKYGVYSYAKHFILNEQEKNRSGVFVWASEQSIREIYARGFEIYVDLGGLGIMSSFNCIGSWWTGASEALLTTLLREEWGFHGVVVTDYVNSPYMAVNIGIRAGNDLWLNRNPSCHARHAYNQTPHDTLIYLRRAAKNILYACAHSNNVWDEDDYNAVGIPEVAKTSS